MIKRISSSRLKEAAKSFPVIAITGPRQSGKTTLSKFVFHDRSYVSFENPDHRMRFQNDPRGFLAGYRSGAIFDEAQRCPELFSYLQQIVDESGSMGQFVLTGSSQFEMNASITQSLAGRSASLRLLPFSVPELSDDFPEIQDVMYIDQLLWKGLYPPIWDRKPDPSLWHSNYVHNYVERDVRSLLNIAELSTFHRFLKLCAARNGQLVNFSEIGAAAGISHNTVKSWISVLEASYIIFLLKPYFNNFSKRLVKTSKLYFYDTGLLCWLLSIQTSEQLGFHPMRGAIFESFVISELYKQAMNQLRTPELYFWRDRSGNEIDLIIDKGIEQIPVEIKSGATFQSRFTQMVSKWQDISKSKHPPVVVYGGTDAFDFNSCRVVPWTQLSTVDPAL